MLDEYRREACFALQWLAFSKRPLHIAEVCLTLLVRFDKAGSLTQKSFDESPLLRYAAQFWPNKYTQDGSGSSLR